MARDEAILVINYSFPQARSFSSRDNGNSLPYSFWILLVSATYLENAEEKRETYSLWCSSTIIFNKNYQNCFWLKIDCRRYLYGSSPLSTIFSPQPPHPPLCRCRGRGCSRKGGKPYVWITGKRQRLRVCIYTHAYIYIWELRKRSMKGGFLCVSLWVCNEQSRLKFFFLKWRKYFFWLKFWRKFM